MGLDFLSAVRSQPLSRIQREQTLNKVFGLVGNLDVILVPFDVSGKDILEDLLWRFVVERRNAIEELVRDDSQSPLNHSVSVRRLPNMHDTYPVDRSIVAT